MTFYALSLILLSVWLHALWHFLCKASRPPFAFFLFVSLSNFLFLTFFVYLGGINLSALSGRIFLFAFAGGASGALCDLGLSLAYRHADISLAYPMARALPVLFTSLFSLVSFAVGCGERLPGHPSLYFAGISLLFIGALGLPLNSWRGFGDFRIWNWGMLGIFLAALGTTGYTVFDYFGIQAIAKHAADVPVLYRACTYSWMREFSLACCLLFVVFVVFRDKPRDVWTLGRQFRPWLAGIFAGMAYLCVLLAMNDSRVLNVSYIQAFRQLSLPIGVMFGVVFLREKLNCHKCLCLAMILAGLVLLAAA